MSVNSLDSPEVHNLLGNIFDSTPVSEFDNYVGSACYELRRSFGHHEDHQFFTVLESRLPDWISDGLLFGPYERSVLAQLVYSASNVIIVRGGTGSGKSSLVAVLNKMATESARAGQWEARVGARTFLTAVDLQVPGVKLTSPVPEGAQRHEQSATLYRKLADRFWNRFVSIVSEKSAREILKCIIDDSICEDDLFGNVADATMALKAAVGWDESGCAAMSSTDLIAHFGRSMKSIPSPETHLYVSLLPFAELGRMHQRAGDKRFVLIVDNLDPLPSYLQSNLWATLNGFFCCESTKSCGLVMGLFLRISSAYDPVGAFSQNVVTNHAAPDASDVVFYRTTYFMLDPTQIKGWTVLPRKTQLALSKRLALLWSSVSNRDSQASEVLNALSGTNLRNAFEYAKRWIIGIQFRDESQYLGKSWEEIAATVREALLGVKCNEIGRAVVEGLRLKMHEVDIRRIVTDGGPSKAGKLIGLALTKIAYQSFRDFGMFKAGSSTEEHLRRLVSNEIHKRASTLESFRAAVPPFAESVLGVGITELINKHSEAINFGTNEFSEATGVTIAEPELAFASAMTDAVKDGFSIYCTKQCKRMHLHMTELSSWKVEHFADSIGDLKDVITSQYKSFHEYKKNNRTRSQYNLARRIESLVGAHSRHSLLAPLIQTAESLSSLATNLFTIDGRRVCGVQLRILAWLKAARFLNQRSVASLSDDLKRHGYNEAEMRGAITEMIGSDRRLIFSSTDDDFQGTTALVDDRDRPLGLSWAGFGHCLTLVKMPVYLQYCFLSISDICDEAKELERKEDRGGWGSRDGVLFKMWSVLIGFEAIVKDENVRLKSIYEGHLASCGGVQKEAQNLMRRQELEVESVSLGIYFDSIHQFVLAMCRHAQNAKQTNSLDEFERTRNLLGRWIEKGSHWLEQHSTWFGKMGTQIGMWGQSIQIVKEIVQRL